MKRPLKLMFVLMVIGILPASLPACATQTQADLHMTALDEMPAQVRSAPVTVQEAYQFSSANPDLMKNIPCYCGCGNVGHTSNYSCYVKEVKPSGEIVFDQLDYYSSVALGFYNSGISNASVVGYDVHGWGLLEDLEFGGTFGYHGSAVKTLSVGDITAGNVFQFAVDVDLRKMWFGHNGAFVGDPAAARNRTADLPASGDSDRGRSRAVLSAKSADPERCSHCFGSCSYPFGYRFRSRRR